MRDFPYLKGQDNGSEQVSGSNDDAPKKNHFYALRSRGDQETSPDMVTDMFKVYCIVVYALIDHSATF